MATSSQAKTLLGNLGTELSDLKARLNNVFDYIFNNNLAFGPIATDAPQSKTTNFAGRYVTFTTPATASQEAAVAHGLGRIPNMCFQVVSPRVVNAGFLGDLTVTRAADANRLYLSSAETNATVYLYVE